MMAMFRALVITVFLIVIPWAALFGTSLPDAIKALKEGRWPTLASLWPGSASAKGPAAAEEPPKFEPAAAVAASNAASPAVTPRPAGAPLPMEPPVLANSWSGDAPRGGAGGVVAAAYETPAVAGRQPARLPSAAAAAASDPFTATQNRLRQLGATYYLLESLQSWGGQPQQYRFFCKVAAGGNPNYTHCFEDTETEPLRAMSRVLQQVETWTAGPR
jgi:hypothetical protein